MVAGIPFLTGVAGAQEHAPVVQDHSPGPSAKIPPSLEAEHNEIHADLGKIVEAGGETGEAAKALVAVLHPHFVREQEEVMPLLGLLPDLGNGVLTREIVETAKLGEKLKADLPRMLEEHGKIVAVLEKLQAAAGREKNAEATAFVEKLKQHARTEEEVLYPAAILVVEYVRLRTDS